MRLRLKSIPNVKKQKGSENGIALFMVISALALLSVLVAELTYSTQMNSRLAYNYLDNLKAFYLAKSGFKISLLRIKAFVKVKSFINHPDNKAIKDTLGKGIADKIWSMPFVFPIPIPKEASMAEGDAIKTFLKKSALPGSYVANIIAESSKLNLNNLLIKTAPSATPSPNASASVVGVTTPTPTPTASPSPMVFREVLEPTLTGLLEQRKKDDREFSDVYRNVTGKDLVDAILAYLNDNTIQPNLPGFKPIQPKMAPFYSISELHLIPGIDDELYKLLEDALTVYSTPGINVNTISKTMLLSLVPELSEVDLDDIIRKRDDPEVGQPWGSEQEFWESISNSSAGKHLEDIKSRFQKANLKVITAEESFKINIMATVGLSTKRLEAYVTTDPDKKSEPKGNSASDLPPGVNVAGAPNKQTEEASSKKPTGVNLIYWRML